MKVREATSNDPWGPSSTQMSEIADLTYNVVAFSEIMQVRKLLSTSKCFVQPSQFEEPGPFPDCNFTDWHFTEFSQKA